jgi:transposase
MKWVLCAAAQRRRLHTGVSKPVESLTLERFVSPPAIRELRNLTRYRVQQGRDRTREVNRLCKVLEDAGLKLTSVVSDVMGASGRAMLTALVKGTTDAAVLADLAQGKLRKKLPELRRALQGRFRPPPCVSH